MFHQRIAIAFPNDDAVIGSHRILLFVGNFWQRLHRFHFHLAWIKIESRTQYKTFNPKELDYHFEMKLGQGPVFLAA